VNPQPKCGTNGGSVWWNAAGGKVCGRWQVVVVQAGGGGGVKKSPRCVHPVVR